MVGAAAPNLRDARLAPPWVFRRTQQAYRMIGIVTVTASTGRVIFEYQSNNNSSSSTFSQDPIVVQWSNGVQSGTGSLQGAVVCFLVVATNTD